MKSIAVIQQNVNVNPLFLFLQSPMISSAENERLNEYIFKDVSARFSLIRAAGIRSIPTIDNCLRERPQESMRASKSQSENPRMPLSVFKFGREQIVFLFSSDRIMSQPNSKSSSLLELAIASRPINLYLNLSDLSVEQQPLITEATSSGCYLVLSTSNSNSQRLGRQTLTRVSLNVQS